MKKQLSHYFITGAALFSLLGLAAFPLSASASSQSNSNHQITSFGPRITHGTSSIKPDNGTVSLNDNWSGYADVPTAPDTFTSVKGTWVQPSITCYQATDTEFAPHWVGLDGFSSATVEQGGTESSCTKGVIKYQAWFENYPKSATFLSTTTYPVTPGDTMFASVTDTGVSGTNTGFTVINQDVTAGWTHTAKLLLPTSDGPFGTSAEWITEDLGGYLPDFNSVTFTSATATDVNNVSGSISAFPHHQTDITDSNNVNLVTPSALNGTGYSFENTWYAAQ